MRSAFSCIRAWGDRCHASQADAIWERDDVHVPYQSANGITVLQGEDYGRHICKTLKKRLLQDHDSFRAMVTTGARNHAAVTGHKNIASFYELEKKGAKYVVLMEYAGSRTLQDVLHDSGPLQEPSAQDLAYQLLQALAHMDSQGIVHRDIKPSNVCVGDDGTTWKLIDLSEAARPGEDTIWFAGTLQYMAPEYLQLLMSGQQKDNDAVAAVTTNKLDVWALGGVVYACLTGSAPFSSYKTLDSLGEMVNSGRLDFAAPAAGAAPLSEEAQAFVRQCMTWDTSLRPSARELMQHPWLAAQHKARRHSRPHSKSKSKHRQAEVHVSAELLPAA